jgi:hypothetical protein
MHAVDEEQETPFRYAVREPAGTGIDWSDQLEPSHNSASGRALVPFVE